VSKSIELTQNKVTVVDDEYYEELSKFKWYAAEIKPSCFYTIRNYRSEDGKRHSLRLHRVVWEIKNGRIPVGVQIDHINHDTLDNRLENLRLCNTSENQANQRKASNKLSKFKGVTWYKARNKWGVRICCHRKLLYLGLFESEIAAAKAYDEKARELFGEFANLNFPEQTFYRVSV
jgi:hypothetical protein